MFVSILRWLYRWTRLRPSDGTFRRFGRRFRSLQSLPVRMKDGRVLYLDLSNPVSVPYLLQGDFPPERVESALVRALVRPGDVAVDVGANLGWYTSLLCEAAGSGGIVHAFEPNPHLVALLRRLEKAYPSLKVHLAAVGAEERWAEFYIPDNWVSGSLVSAEEGADTRTTRVVPLARAIGETEVDFIKVDAEGAEFDVLHGATDYVNSRNAPIWLMELSTEEAGRFGRHPCDLVEVFAAAGRAGYTAFSIEEKAHRLRPLELPDSGEFWMNGLFVPASRLGRIPVEWLPEGPGEGVYLPEVSGYTREASRKQPVAEG